jgi:beta-lactamase superfamily II metal-dependent hydrolase
MSIEIEFLPCGDDHGDAICVRFGNDQQGYQIHVIDGGYANTADTIIGHIESNYGRNVTIANVVLTHADDDHATGLAKVIERFPVQNIWMNRPWLFVRETIQHFHKNFGEEGLYKKMRELHPYLIDIEDVAARKNPRPQINNVFQGTMIGPFLVLAPERNRYIEMIPFIEKTPKSYSAEAAQNTLLGGLFTEAKKAVQEYLDERWHIETLSNNPEPPTSYSNESSVIQYATIEGKQILLTGDAGPVALSEAVNYAAGRGLQRPDFVQVPHHGSRHNVTPDVLNAWLGPIQGENDKRRGVAVASVGTKKLDYPRGQVVNAFKRRGFPIWTMRGQPMCMQYNRDHRPGWSSVEPEPFRTKVEK